MSSAVQKLTDSGTRYAHYRELLELWESTSEVLDSHRFQSSKTKEKKAQLAAAITILRKQIEVLAELEDGLFKLRKNIREAHEFAEATKATGAVTGDC